MSVSRIIQKLLTPLAAGCLVLSAAADVRSDIAAAATGVELKLSSASGIVIEQSTGEVLYEQNADERMEPASVTKVMSLLLIFEALDDGTLSLTDTVTGSEKASSMGGSQIWLENGETMSVDDMIKAMAVASANDCTVAMAEHLAGSEEAFVVRMNERAAALGMENTHFSNCTGLPVEDHYTTARDITTMTRELLKHEKIFDYTTIWMDSLRGGKMGLTNTNKLIRFYNGANGMKTGYTASAKYCLSATAKRDGMQLIAAVMKGPTSDDRFSDAKKLLDFGFANYAVHLIDESDPDPLYVRGGAEMYAAVGTEQKQILLPKGAVSRLCKEMTLPETLTAPVTAGDTVGSVRYTLDGNVVAELPIVARESVERINMGILINRLVKAVAVFRQNDG